MEIVIALVKLATTLPTPPTAVAPLLLKARDGDRIDKKSSKRQERLAALKQQQHCPAPHRGLPSGFITACAQIDSLAKATMDARFHIWIAYASGHAAAV